MATRLLPGGWHGRAKRIPFLTQVVRVLRAGINPEFRSLWRLQRDRRSGLLQPSPTTSANRYPQIFSFLGAALADATDPRILSYGCSTGEEVFSLHHRCAGAQITGIDINPHSISIAKRRLDGQKLSGITFECASSPAALPTAHFDAILCMAVLQHGALRLDSPISCADHIRFADVAAIITGLARCLKPGGLLVIWQSFSLCRHARGGAL